MYNAKRYDCTFKAVEAGQIFSLYINFKYSVELTWWGSRCRSIDPAWYGKWWLIAHKDQATSRGRRDEPHSKTQNNQSRIKKPSFTTIINHKYKKLKMGCFLISFYFITIFYFILSQKHVIRCMSFSTTIEHNLGHLCCCLLIFLVGSTQR